MTLVRTGARLTPAQLKAEIGVFILGGFATTAHALSYTLFALAVKPAVQRAIEAELSAAGLLTPDMRARRQLQQGDLRSLVYLGFVIKESLRMFPVIAGVPRCGRRQSSAAWAGACTARMCMSSDVRVIRACAAQANKQGHRAGALQDSQQRHGIKNQGTLH